MLSRLFRKPKPHPTFITAHLNCRLTPNDREHVFGDPLNDALKKAGLGEVSGGGSLMSPEGEIIHIDLELMLNELTETALDLAIKVLNSRQAPKGSWLHLDDGTVLHEFGNSEVLGLYLDGVSLPAEVYEAFDTDAFLDDVLAALDGAGRFQGDHVMRTHTALFFVGDDFHAMRTRLSPLVEKTPICQNARIEQIA
ncbi:hypothetical protein [Aliiroseovarius sp. 2305UL8-7]|uniref:hypothetical protein n=1 Tax=Aliiroseovarius conchicola TaxID=3121637 RepID=UPI003526E83E